MVIFEKFGILKWNNKYLLYKVFFLDLKKVILVILMEENNKK